MKVAKFGGSSVADPGQIGKVVDIIRSDSSRRCIIVSAPGKRFPEDTRVTEMLKQLCRFNTKQERHLFGKSVARRYQEIADSFGLKINFEEEVSMALGTFERMDQGLEEYSRDFLLSRGEYWMAEILSQILGYTFVDAHSFIAFNENGIFDLDETKKSSETICLKRATNKGIVVPGYYGSMPNGTIKIFSDGGSDFSGAVAAACIGADLYENWTDVSGVYMAHPSIVKNPRVIGKLTYSELRELAYTGANVLHDESIFPVRKMGIPINVRNTNRPQDEGTMIVPKNKLKKRTAGDIIGISGEKGFAVIRIEKSMMDKEVGFLRRVCEVMEENEINIEHIPSGIDTLSVIVESAKLKTIRRKVLKNLHDRCNPDLITIEKDMALICVVGNAMRESPGTAAKIIEAIANAGVNIRMIDQCSSEINIIVGVNEKNYEATIRAIYAKFA
jgi:aspartate kinase